MPATATSRQYIEHGRARLKPPSRARLQPQRRRQRPTPDYAPAQTVTIADGASETMEFRGRSSSALAFDALTVGGDYEGLRATARTNSGDTVLFRDVHLTALRRLFLRRRLKGLLEVDEGRKLELDIENHSGTESKVNVALSAYAGADRIEEQKACLRGAYGYVPRPQLVAGFAEVSAGANAQRVTVEQRPARISFARWMVGCDDESALDSWLIKLRVYDRTVREEVYAEQIIDQFTNAETARPYLLEAKTPMQVVVTSDAGSALGFSVVFESYRTAAQEEAAQEEAATNAQAATQQAQQQQQQQQQASASNRIAYRPGCSW